MLSKKEQKRERIMQSALELFVLKGFYNTTILDISTKEKTRKIIEVYFKIAFLRIYLSTREQIFLAHRRRSEAKL